MLLACDIGNTNIKSGLFSGNALTEFFMFTTPEEFISYAGKKEIKNLVASSVVPSKLAIIRNRLDKKISLTEISLHTPFNLKVEYNSPETLGVDRLCSCEGAFFLYSNSEEYPFYNPNTKIVTIDFGTATTINFVRYPGIFEGGIIAPGLQLMNDSLHAGTAQLTHVELTDYQSFIGKSTSQSIASGIINSTTGLIEQVIKFIKNDDPDADIKFFLTGGNAAKLKPFINFNYTFEKALVLYGIRAVSRLIFQEF